MAKYFMELIKEIEEVEKLGDDTMEKTNIEELYEWLDRTAETIQQHKDEPYLDSLSIALETLFYNQPSDSIDDILSFKLADYLKEVDLTVYSTEDIRKSVQLAILKGMQRSTQSQHLITPESVALLVGYLVGKLTKEKQDLRIFDPVAGVGNLLTTVLSELENVDQAYASEVDYTLIQIALYNANLQKMNIEYFHQDSLRPLLLDPVDAVVADLPVGYYPDDVRASNFELKANEGHSYAHHLLIEQSINYTKDAGYLVLLVPEFLFDSEQSDQLQPYLQKNVHIVGLLRLPDSAFSSKKNIKSILVLQKKGENTKAPHQPLLVNLPSLSNTAAMEDIMSQINEWFKAYSV